MDGKAADSIAKMGLVVEEVDESEFWLAFIKAVPIADDAEVD